MTLPFHFMNSEEYKSSILETNEHLRSWDVPIKPLD